MKTLNLREISYYKSALNKHMQKTKKDDDDDLDNPANDQSTPIMDKKKTKKDNN